MVRMRILAIGMLLLGGLLFQVVSSVGAEGNGYVVRSGDTLYGIATRHGTTVEHLMALNGLASPTIYVGQMLLVSSDGASSSPASQPAAGASTHVVREGETLFGIALHYGTTVAQLRAWNGLSSDVIWIGQRLKVSGVSAPNVPSASAAPSVSHGGTHVVQPGETLFGIALRYETTVARLKTLNGLPNDLIYVGQVLKVSGTAVPAANAGTSHPSAPAAAGGNRHVVQSGETLYGIALRYGTTVGALKRLNGLHNYFIYAGQVLTVQGSAEPHQASEPQKGYHTVVAGDSLSVIARRYRTTVRALKHANHLTSDVILIGQRLVIPHWVDQEMVVSEERKYQASQVYYWVQPGDTLTWIAATHGVSVGALAQVNGLRVGDVIYAGQKLQIPIGAHHPAPPPAADPVVPGKHYYHVVRPGETLSHIAATYHTTVKALVIANHLKEPNHIFVGQRLYVPGHAPIAATPKPHPTVVHVYPTKVPTRVWSSPTPMAQAPVVASPTPGAPYVPPTATTYVPHVYPTATPYVPPTVVHVYPTATPYVPPTVVHVYPTATTYVPPPPTAIPASPTPGAPYVPSPTAVGAQAADSPPELIYIWQGQLVESTCGNEDTHEYRSAVFVSVEGRTGQSVDIFADPMQDSTFIAWAQTGGKAGLDAYTAELAPLGAGNYIVSVSGLAVSAPFYLDGQCTAKLHFRRVVQE